MKCIFKVFKNKLSKNSSNYKDLLKRRVEKTLIKLNAIDGNDKKATKIIDEEVDSIDNKIEYNKNFKSDVPSVFAIAFSAISIIISIINSSLANSSKINNGLAQLNNATYDDINNVFKYFLFVVLFFVMLFLATQFINSCNREKYFYVDKCWERIKLNQENKNTKNKTKSKK